MMLKPLSTTLLFILLFLSASISLQKLYNLHDYRRDLRLSRISKIPPAFLKVASLEYQGVLADYLFMNVLSFTGDKVLRGKKIEEQDWETVYKLLVQIQELDPEASDPFILATTVLPWEAGMIEETNKILLKSAQTRGDDYRPYFFLWFNHFHFLKDPKTAGHYLQKASQKPNAPDYFGPLVSRMQLMAGEIDNSVIFLKSLLQETSDLKMKDYLLVRIDALERINYLENGIDQFIETYKRPPLNLKELVIKNIIPEIPEDPYGGRFYIIAPGRVYTTSKLVKVKK